MIFRRRDDDAYDSTSLWATLMHPFRSLGHAISDLLKGDDRIGTEMSFFSRIVRLFTLPFRLLFGFMVFMVHSWTSSRPGFAFIGAIPAMVVAGLFFGALLAADFINNEARSLGSTFGYLEYQKTTAREHPEYAHIFAEKLVELKPDDPNFKYQLALSYDRMANPIKAFDVMSSITNSDSGGLADAHIWLSRYYLTSQQVFLDDAQREEMSRKHLAIAVEKDPDNQMAHVSLASLFIDKSKSFEPGSEEYNKNVESAIEHLNTIVNGELSIYQLRAIPLLAELQISMGHEAAAHRWLGAQINRLRPIAHKRPEIFQLWFTLVRSAILAKDYPLALEIVKEALQIADSAEDKRKIRQLASLTLLQKSEDFKDMGDQEHYQSRLYALCEAIQTNPTDRAVYLKLLDFIGNRPVTETLKSETQLRVGEIVGERLDFSQAGEFWMSDSIIGSPTPGVIHALLGMRDVSQGNVSDGEKHWRIAEQQFASTQIVINNLIDVAAKDRPDEFSNMQDMITLGIELFPEQPIFYQTRGVFFKNQGKFNEAIADLLYASEKMPKMIALHQHLIDCYRELNDEQKVIEHQIQLQDKLSHLDEADRKRVESSMRRND